MTTARLKREKEIILSLLACYYGLVVIASWWPFHFQFHPLPGSSVEWPPFELLSPRYWGDGKKDLLKIVTFVPVGIFLALMSDLQWKKTNFVWRTTLVAICLSVAMQLGWFFLPGRLISATNIVMNVAGVLAGIVPLFFRFFSQKTLLTFLAIYCGCFLVAATWPWSFSLGPPSLAGILRRIEWLPFNGYLLRTWVVKEAVLNSLMMVPLGLLAASLVFRGDGTRRQALSNAAWIGCSCSFLVEFIQYFLPIRTPSFGDIAVNTAGAFLGGWAACYLESWHEKHAWIESSNRDLLPSNSPDA